MTIIQPQFVLPPVAKRSLPVTPAANNRRFDILKQSDNSRAFSFAGSFEFSSDNTAVLANHPIEGGAFYSTNKVSSPATCSLLVVTANEQEANALLRQCDFYINSTDLFKIVTPYRVIENMTLKGMPQRHAPEQFYASVGITLTFGEVMLNNKTRTGKTAEPKAAGVSHGGQVTAKDVSKK